MEGIPREPGTQTSRRQHHSPDGCRGQRGPNERGSQVLFEQEGPTEGGWSCRADGER